MLLLPEEGGKLSLETILLTLLSLLQFHQSHQLLIRLPRQFGVLLSQSLQGTDAFPIVILKNMPKLIGEVEAVLLREFCPKQEDLLRRVEVVPYQKSQGIIVLIPTPLELKPCQSVKEFGKVLFVPVQGEIEMRIGSKMTAEDSCLSCEDADTTQLKLVVLGHDGVVVVVVEEHYVRSVLEAVASVTGLPATAHR